MEDLMELSNELAGNPQELERRFRAAVKEGRGGEFEAAIAALFERDPGDPVIQAWYYRLQPADETAAAPRRSVNWLLAAPFSILTGLIFWALSDFERGLVMGEVPQLIFWWSPIATMGALVFLALASKSKLARALALGVGLLGAAVYALLLGPGREPDWVSEQYLLLAAIHIPLLSWAALAIFILGRRSTVADRIAFLIKSIEVMITAGLYLIFGMVFGGITIGMFAALGIEPPELWLRLIAAGGFGLLPVLAVASVYDPARPPSDQDFDQGLSRFIGTMMRLLLPLTLGVLVIYTVFIPFNFFEPFENRDLLIVFNLMLFGIMGLLLGATPIRGEELSPELARWLRRGILAVAVLAGLVSLYALSAVIYRTIGGGLTLNRVTVIGWNGINIAILLSLVYAQLKRAPGEWITALHSVFSRAAGVYLAWGLFLVFVLPLLF
jgi:hypothetical protein